MGARPVNTGSGIKTRQTHLLLGLREGLDERGRVLVLLGADEGVGRPLAARAARPPDTVDVVLKVVGARVVDHAHKVGHVEPPADVGRNAQVAGVRGRVAARCTTGRVDDAKKLCRLRQTSVNIAVATCPGVRPTVCTRGGGCFASKLSKQGITKYPLLFGPSAQTHLPATLVATISVADLFLKSAMVKSLSVWSLPPCRDSPLYPARERSWRRAGRQ